MIDLVEQANEAATRSQKLATANRAVDESRNGELHPAVASALGVKTTEPAAIGPAPTKDRGPADPAAPSDKPDQKPSEKTPDRTPKAADPERDAALDRLMSPAKMIASSMRVQKNTGRVQACEEHHDHLDVWHLIGHIGRAAKQVGSYGLHGSTATAGLPAVEQKGFLAGVSAGMRDAKKSPQEEIVAAAVANADKPRAVEAKRSSGKARNTGGMEL